MSDMWTPLCDNFPMQGVFYRGSNWLMSTHEQAWAEDESKNFTSSANEYSDSSDSLKSVTPGSKRTRSSGAPRRKRTKGCRRPEEKIIVLKFRQLTTAWIPDRHFSEKSRMIIHMKTRMTERALLNGKQWDTDKRTRVSHFEFPVFRYLDEAAYVFIYERVEAVQLFCGSVRMNELFWNDRLFHEIISYLVALGVYISKFLCAAWLHSCQLHRRRGEKRRHLIRHRRNTAFDRLAEFGFTLHLPTSQKPYVLVRDYAIIRECYPSLPTVLAILSLWRRRGSPFSNLPLELLYAILDQSCYKTQTVGRGILPHWKMCIDLLFSVATAQAAAITISGSIRTK